MIDGETDATRARYVALLEGHVVVVSHDLSGQGGFALHELGAHNLGFSVLGKLHGDFLHLRRAGVDWVGGEEVADGEDGDGDEGEDVLTHVSSWDGKGDEKS